MLSPEQVEEFETNGYTLVESTLSPQELDDAEATWERLMSKTNPREGREEDEGWVRLGLYPIVTAQHSSTTRYTSFPIIFSRCFLK